MQMGGSTLGPVSAGRHAPPVCGGRHPPGFVASCRRQGAPSWRLRKRTRRTELQDAGSGRSRWQSFGNLSTRRVAGNSNSRGRNDSADNIDQAVCLL